MRVVSPDCDSGRVLACSIPVQSVRAQTVSAMPECLSAKLLLFPSWCVGSSQTETGPCAMVCLYPSSMTEMRKRMPCL